MKLSSDPKPVKFRIVSGGEEHSSLDSLRNNFCVSDLQKIETQLVQWLNRQGLEGEEIAEQLNLHDLNSVEDYFIVYKLFFQKEFKNNRIETPLQLLEYWHGQKEHSKNIDQLARLGFEKDDDITIFCYCHRNEIDGLTNDWLTVLKNICSKTDEVNMWIAEEQLRYQKQERQERQKINYYIRDVNVRRLKQHIKQHFPDRCGWAKYSYSPNEEKIKTFVENCKTIKNFHMNYHDARDRFFMIMPILFADKNEFTIRRKKDFLFDAKLFILLLIYRYQRQKPHNDVWIKEFPNVISQKQDEIMGNYNPPAMYERELENYINYFVMNDLFKFLDLE